MKLSDYIAHVLVKEGIHTVFGYQGSSVSHLIDSICNADIKYVQNYHEQASAFAACGYAEATHNLGVAVACSGPGATNLITGIANAYYDSLPCLFIVGQVSSHELKDNGSRQNGFQETKIVDIVKPITKYAVEILDPQSLAEELQKAIMIAKTGRKGPVLISIPHNVQQAQIENEVIWAEPTISKEPIDTSLVADLLHKSKQPLLLIGGGAFELKGNPAFQKFTQKYKIPVVASLRGLNNVCFNDEFSGFLGVYGNRLANLAVFGSDLLIVFGSRLDSRQTGGIRDNFAPNAKIIQVDADANEIGREFPIDYTFNCTCVEFIDSVKNYFDDSKHEYREWHNKLADINKYCTSEIQSQGADPNLLVEYISNILQKDDTLVTTDVGQNQMWVAQSIKMSDSSSFLTSGGHGTMGYSLPAAIGGYYAKPKTTIVCYMGDGGLQMNIQELETLRREQIPAVIVVFRNSTLGLIRDYQTKALNGRLNGSVTGFSVPDLSKLAVLYDMDYLHISNNDFSAIQYSALVNKRIIIDVEVSKESEILPELAYKRAIYDQRPFVDIDKIKSILNQ